MIPLVTDLGWGDFWSSFILLPAYIIAYLFLKLGKKHITVPRMGMMKFGPIRKAKLKMIVVWMLIILILGVVVNVIVSVAFKPIGLLFPVFFSLFLFGCFSLGGYYLDYSRLYYYGLLAGGAFMIGEILYRTAGIRHHGIPLCLGISGGLMMLLGFVQLIRFVKKYPVSHEEQANG